MPGYISRFIRNDLSLRLAQESDSKRLHAWRNGFDARKFSRNSDLISWEDHVAWFENRLNSSEDANAIYIMLKSRKPIGMIRFDSANEESAEISILVDPTFQGKGFGSEILRQAIDYAFNFLEVLELNAWIHVSNVASKKLFEKFGFIEIGNEGPFNFYRLSKQV